VPARACRSVSSRPACPMWAARRTRGWRA
jgi:hypothetical protein